MHEEREEEGHSLRGTGSGKRRAAGRLRGTGSGKRKEASFATEKEEGGLIFIIKDAKRKEASIAIKEASFAIKGWRVFCAAAKRCNL